MLLPADLDSYKGSVSSEQAKLITVHLESTKASMRQQALMLMLSWSGVL